MNLLSIEGELTVKEAMRLKSLLKTFTRVMLRRCFQHLDAIHRKSWDEIEEAFNDERHD